MAVHKRPSSPTLLEGEAKSHKKMHSIAAPSHAKASAMGDGNKQSNFVIETGVSSLASSEKFGFIWFSFIDLYICKI